jgi:hypothetical protein
MADSFLETPLKRQGFEFKDSLKREEYSSRGRKISY